MPFVRRHISFIGNIIGTHGVILVGLMGFLPTSARADDSMPTKNAESNSGLTAELQAILDLTNKERQKYGLPPLKPDATLMKVAGDHSTNMVRRNSLNHTLDGKSPFDRMTAAGYAFGSAGENIAFGAITPEEVVQVWMHSPGHRSNILSRQYSEIGIGIATSDRGRIYHTQVFATPLRSGGPKSSSVHAAGSTGR